MAPTIWGLNLGEMKWGKFKSSYMFGNKDYHLRRTKFIVYQLALIFTVVSESLGTSALSNYVDEQKLVQKLNPSAYNYNNDYVGAASFNIFAGVFTAFIFGAAFFFDLFWPMRHEDRGIRIAWKGCGVASVVFVLASALELTIITARNSGYVDGVSPSEAEELLRQYKKYSITPLRYKDNGRALAAVVFVWLGFVFTFASCVILFYSIDNAEKGPGPLTAHARAAEMAQTDPHRDPEAAYAMDESEDSAEKARNTAPEGAAADMPREPTPAATY